MVIRKFPAKISRAPTTDRRDQRFNNNNNKQRRCNGGRRPSSWAGIVYLWCGAVVTGSAWTTTACRAAAPRAVAARIVSSVRSAGRSTCDLSLTPGNEYSFRGTRFACDTRVTVALGMWAYVCFFSRDDVSQLPEHRRLVGGSIRRPRVHGGTRWFRHGTPATPLRRPQPTSRIRCSGLAAAAPSPGTGQRTRRRRAAAAATAAPPATASIVVRQP